MRIDSISPKTITHKKERIHYVRSEVRVANLTYFDVSVVYRKQKTTIVQMRDIKRGYNHLLYQQWLTSLLV